MMLYGSVEMMMKNAAQGVQTSLVGFARRNDGVPAGCVCGVACVPARHVCPSPVLVLCTKHQDAFCPVWGALEHDVQLAAHDHR